MALISTGKRVGFPRRQRKRKVPQKKTFWETFHFYYKKDGKTNIF